MSESIPEDEADTVNVDFLQICGVDFNLLHILDNVFQYLSEKDLTAVYCVNKTWCSVVKKTTCANKRRTQYLSDIRKLKETVGEENWPIKRGPIEQRALEPRLAFSDIKNTKKKRLETETPSNLVGSQSAAVISTTSQTHRNTNLKRRAIFTPLKSGCEPQCLPLNGAAVTNSTYLFSEETKTKQVLLGSRQSKRNLKRL